MTAKKVVATRSPATGSYTVRIPKSTRTGKFVSQPGRPGRIEVGKSAKKPA